MINVDLVRGLCQANSDLGVAVVELLVLVDETIPLYESLLASGSVTDEQRDHLAKLKAKGTR